MNTPNNRSVQNSPAAQPIVQPLVMNVRLNYNPRQKDPLPKSEKDLSVSPDIDNNGGSLERFGTYNIVDTYGDEQSKQRQMNDDGLTNVESFMVRETEFVSTYIEDSLDYLEYSNDRTYNFYTSYQGDDFQFGQSNYFDDGLSCTMTPGLLGGTLGSGYFDTNPWGFENNYFGNPGEFSFADGAGLGTSGFGEGDLSVGTTSSFETGSADGPTAEAANDAQFETAEGPTDAPAETTPADAPASFSSAESGIQSGVNLSGAFASASSPTPEEPEAAPAVAPQAMTMAAANNQSYQRSA